MQHCKTLCQAVNACRKVFGDAVPAYLCIWHVQRCWLDHLLRKVKSKELRWPMLFALRAVMFFLPEPGMGSAEFRAKLDQRMDAFFTEFAAQTQFLRYFRSRWVPKLGTLLPY